MTNLLHSLAAAVFTILMLAASSLLGAPKELFNGRDLAGWIPMHGGEWNKVRITCKGRRIQINLNGDDIIDYQTDRLTRGYIGLQNHDNHAVVKFRNIRLTES